MNGTDDGITLYLAWDAADLADAAWAGELAGKLNAALPGIVGTRLPAPPPIELIAGFENVPSADDLGALSVLLVVLPDQDRGFTPDAAARLATVADPAAGSWEGRVLAIGREPQRLPPPAPLDWLQGLAAQDLDLGRVEEIAKAALIHATLRLSLESQGSLFISYSHRDAWGLAEALARKLKTRGYRVFRDENRDRDDMISIPPGSPTQKVLEDAILSHGFVLLLDSPAAQGSAWVRREVDVAFGNLLPVLPVVVEGLPNESNASPPRGGRFRSVRELDREVRLGSEALGVAGGPGVEAAVDGAIDALESQVVDTLLGHLRSRRRLIHGSRQRFEALRYEWQDHVRQRLQFAVARSRGSQARTVTRRMLVQCSPYPRLLRKTVDVLDSRFKERSPGTQPFNDAVLVHNSIALDDDVAEARLGRDYIYVLRPYEIVEEAFL
jgi:TIR domain